MLFLDEKQTKNELKTQNKRLYTLVDLVGKCKIVKKKICTLVATEYLPA